MSYSGPRGTIRSLIQSSYLTGTPTDIGNMKSFLSRQEIDFFNVISYKIRIQPSEHIYKNNKKSNVTNMNGTAIVVILWTILMGETFL